MIPEKMIPAGYVEYKVVCDETNNTEETRAEGRLVADVTLRPKFCSLDKIDLDLLVTDVVDRLKMDAADEADLRAAIDKYSR